MEQVALGVHAYAGPSVSYPIHGALRSLGRMHIPHARLINEQYTFIISTPRLTRLVPQYQTCDLYTPLVGHM